MQPQRGVCGTPASILPVADGRAEGILVYRERHKDAEIQVNAGGHLQSAVVLRPLEFDFMLFNRWVIGVSGWATTTTTIIIVIASIIITIIIVIFIMISFPTCQVDLPLMAVPGP